MKRTLLAIAAFALVLSSCQKEADVSDNAKKGGENTMSFNATILSTRTSLSENKVYWSANDSVSINGEIFKATSTGSSTTFTREDSEITAPYNAIFPSSLVDGDNYVLPGTQAYSGSTVDNLPMYATSSDNNLVFQNLCGVLGLTVKKSDMETVKSIRVSCSNTDMCGTFTVENGKAKLSEDTDQKKSVVLESSQAVSTAEAGTTFYIALPEAEYETFTVELSADGSNYTKTMTARKSTIEIAANTIYPWNFLSVGYYLLRENPTVDTVL